MAVMMIRKDKLRLITDPYGNDCKSYKVSGLWGPYCHNCSTNHTSDTFLPNTLNRQVSSCNRADYRFSSLEWCRIDGFSPWLILFILRTSSLILRTSSLILFQFFMFIDFWTCALLRLYLLHSRPPHVVWH